jgi:hypothetical protein
VAVAISAGAAWATSPDLAIVVGRRTAAQRSASSGEAPRRTTGGYLNGRLFYQRGGGVEAVGPLFLPGLGPAPDLLPNDLVARAQSRTDEGAHLTRSSHAYIDLGTDNVSHDPIPTHRPSCCVPGSSRPSSAYPRT